MFVGGRTVLFYCPCKDCEERSENCHSKCKRYRDYQNETQEKKKAFLEHNQKHPTIHKGDFLGDSDLLGRRKLDTKRRKKK